MLAASCNSLRCINILAIGPVHSNGVDGGETGARRRYERNYKSQVRDGEEVDNAQIRTPHFLLPLQKQTAFELANPYRSRESAKRWEDARSSRHERNALIRKNKERRELLAHLGRTVATSDKWVLHYDQGRGPTLYSGKRSYIIIGEMTNLLMCSLRL